MLRLKPINKTTVLMLITLITISTVAPIQLALAKKVTFTCDASMTTDHAGIGSSATYTFTINNTGSAKLGSANLTIPAGYTDISTTITILNKPETQTWTVSLTTQPTLSTDGLIVIQGSGNGLSTGESISFAFTGVNPSSEGEYNWTVVANQNTGTGGNDYKTTIATAPIYVLDHIIINPQWASILAGDSQSFYVTGYGQNNYSLGDITNFVAWSINSGDGTYVWTENSVEVNKAGEWIVTAIYGDKTADSTLIVTGHLADVISIAISPENWSMAAGSSKSFNATASDGYNFWDITDSVAWSIDVAAGGSWIQATGTYTSAYSGTWSVTAYLGALFDTATLTVTANSDLIDHIVISPKTQTIAAGQTLNYTATAFDQYGNSWNADAVYSCPDTNLIISGNSVYCTLAGIYEITGTYSGTFDTASLTVTANSDLIDHIVISPKTQTIAAGSSQSYTVESFDQYGNSLGDVTSSTVLTAPNALVTENIVAANLTGSYIVTASYNGLNDSATLTVYGYTVTFRQSGLPTGISWDIIFSGVTYSSSTDTITIANVSAISYSWSTANCIQMDQTRYITAEIIGSIVVPEQLVQNIGYSTQFLVTYTVNGNTSPVSTPSDEWVNSNDVAKGSFQTQVVSADGKIKCIFSSDNRPSTITKPTLITGEYQTQYLVVYAAAGNALPTDVPPNEWVNAGGLAKGAFTTLITNLESKDVQCIFVDDNRPSTITAPTTITGTYQTQYEVAFEVTGIDSDAVGAVLTIFGDAKDLGQLTYKTWVNSGTQVLFSFADTVASTISDKHYELTEVSTASPTLIEAPGVVKAAYQPQYSTSLFTVALLAIVLLLILLLLLLLAMRRRKKRKPTKFLPII